MVYQQTSLRGRFLGDRGVSPVVGVILMVAITVILAAVVGQFVLDLADILQEPPQAGVQISEDYDEFSGNYTVNVLITQMPNADQIIVRCSDCTGALKEDSASEVGVSATLSDITAGRQIVVIASLGEDNQQVIRTYTVGPNNA